MMKALEAEVMQAYLAYVGSRPQPGYKPPKWEQLSTWVKEALIHVYETAKENYGEE
jgi:hypothetical protein